ncbi:MAG: 5'/3'-nucleotidase SurE [Pirellulales bacterium]|nr:5'/3'-nucleotidase SurE [Pirellulales bacterium]
MNFLLTNDDGIEAPGLAALARAFEGLGSLATVAPDQHLSGCSHQATTHRDLTLTPHGPQRWALDGTPVDCARVGLLHVAPETSWVVSGINAGGNLGADVYLSGTVAAAREAALLGRSGIAVSQYVRRGLPLDWDCAARWTRTVVELLLARYPQRGALWNVNLPHLPSDSRPPDVVFCQLDPHPLPVQFIAQENTFRYFGVYQDRQRMPGHDVAVCFGGAIAVTGLLLG